MTAEWRQRRLYLTFLLPRLAFNMDLGEPCEVITKVGSRAALEEIEALGVVFHEVLHVAAA